MARPEIDEDLEFVGRQLAFLAQDSNLSLDESLVRMRDIGDVNTNEAIDTVRRARSDPGGQQAGVLGQIFRLIRGTSIDERRTGDLIGEYYRLKRETDQDLANYFLALKSTFHYGVAVLSVALIISMIFGFKIVPGFQETFSELGTDLPSFTAFMMADGTNLLTGAILLLLVIIALTGGSLFKAYKDLLGFRYSNMPGMGLLTGRNVFAAMNDYTLLKVMYLLDKAGADKQVAYRFANEMAGRKPENAAPPLSEQVWFRLDFSARNGTYSRELEYQLTHASFRLTEALASFRTTFNVGIQALALILVGSLVIGYYLPIFQLGSTV